MKRKFKATLRIKPGFGNDSLEIQKLIYFITISHCQCSSEGYKFTMKRSTWGNRGSYFDIRNGPALFFVIKEMFRYEKKTSRNLEN